MNIQGEAMAQSSVNWPAAVSIAVCAALAIGVGAAFAKIGGEGTAPARSIAVGEPAPGTNAPPTEEPARPRGLADVDGERIVNADAEPGNWMEHGRTYDEQRFSPLDQINDKTIGQLGLAWSMDTETTRGLEASPIVVDGIMYTSLT